MSSAVPSPVPSARGAAAHPDDLIRLFVERAKAKDIAGLVALFEADAALALPGRATVRGHEEIRRTYEAVLTAGPRLDLEVPQPAIIHGDFALTMTCFPGGAAAQLARRQPDGTWLWTVDRVALGPAG